MSKVFLPFYQPSFILTTGSESMMSFYLMPPSGNGGTPDFKAASDEATSWVICACSRIIRDVEIEIDAIRSCQNANVHGKQG